MKEISGDVWKFHSEGVAICITTNGFVKKNGECVMGRGVALECKMKYPDFPLLLGSKLNYVDGVNNVEWFEDKKIFSFPVKYHWKHMADIDLIKRSCKQLITKLDELEIQRVILPRPGCGNGKLSWERDVKPAIQHLLDDRVEVITFGV